MTDELKQSAVEYYRLEEVVTVERFGVHFVYVSTGSFIVLMLNDLFVVQLARP